MNPELVENFRRLLRAAKGAKLVVAGHMRPDGDCVGSAFALAEILQNAGADVVCVNQNPVPHLYENIAAAQFESAAEFADTSRKVVIVDCSDLQRVNAEFSEKFADVFACIDHHASGRSAAEIKIVDVCAGATAEIIALLARDAGVKISVRAATLLYLGIATDTRQWTTSSTRVESFEAAEFLVKCGVDANYVAQQLYQRERFGKMKLLAQYLQSLQMYLRGRVCFGFIPRGTFEKTDSCKEDTDGLVDFARSIDGVEIAATLEELSDGSIKGSLRGRSPELQVNKIAETFGGGGHLAAAGFTAKNETFNSIIPKLLELCEKSLSRK